MTEQEIRTKYEELGDLETNALHEHNFDLARKYFNQSKKYLKMLSDIQHKRNLKKGLIWDYEDWITTYRSDFVKTSLEDARKNLLDKIKNLHGVKIEYDGNGVKSISVNTRYKTYTYTIHAHYSSHKIDECKNYEYGYIADLERVKY